MSSKMIIWLLAILLIGVSGYLVYWKLRIKIQQIALALFGTNSITKGLKKQADMLAETPKSVSGMTRIFAPQIERDFPEFHLGQFKNKAENLLIAALGAVSEERVELLPKDVSDELKNQVKNQIEGNRAAGVHEVYQQVKIHQTEIANYQKRDGACIITFQSAVEHYHYKKKNGSVIEGEKERKQQTKYNIELLYIQDEKLAKMDNAVGTTCPNCGAPITKLGNKYCEYCGSAVTVVNLKVWTLHRYNEVDYHHVY